MSEDYLRQHFDLVKDKACAIEKRLPEVLDLERLILCSKEFKEDCKKFNIPNLEISDDFPFDADKMAQHIFHSAQKAILS